jgi:hypothetical protein
MGVDGNSAALDGKVFALAALLEHIGKEKA